MRQTPSSRKRVLEDWLTRNRRLAELGGFRAQPAYSAVTESIRI